VPLLLRALAQARDDGRHISCAVIGDGPERARWSAMVQELSLTTQVHFTGRIDDDAAYYGMLKCGRVFAWPSVAEGYGLAPVEAMACGVPVIAAASDLSATPALVRDHGAGVVADPDPAAFARAIRMLLDDEAAWREAGQRASDFARNMTWDRMAHAVEQVYVETIAAAGSSR
jgi:glycosyltransferase involved in cell wall biosynthesis